MQERQVTVDGVTTKLKDPFMVIATKNPIEFAGTYPMPSAQLDRFMFRLIMNYPAREAWVDVLRRKNMRGEALDVKTLVSPEALLSARRMIHEKVKVGDDVIEYIVDLVRSTRSLPQAVLGASPASEVALLNASKGYAAVVGGRDYVTIDDVKAVAFHVLNHRIVFRQEGPALPEEDFGIVRIRTIIDQTVEMVRQ